jgi:histidinol-phosphate aminotransferase
MHAYAVQDATGLIKLDAMENPHTLPPELQAALGARLGAVALNRYPGPRIDDLRSALAEHTGLPPGHTLILGNGSDELISLVALACAVPADQTPDGRRPAVLAPEPGFVMYAVSAQLLGLRFVGVPLTADFALDADAMCAAIAQERPAITYLAYPNNPTAGLWDDGAVARVIDAAGAAGGLVVIDEAYQPFASRNWLDRIRAEPGRHGHVPGPAALVGEIDKVRPPYNVSVLNAECALFALEHAEVFAAQAAEVRAERDRLVAALGQLPGVTVWPSDANMVLVRVPGGNAGAAHTFNELKRRKVLVKNVSTMYPLLAGCLRLTVGTAGENAQLLAALAPSLFSFA